VGTTMILTLRPQNGSQQTPGHAAHSLTIEPCADKRKRKRFSWRVS
jgi:hypothetical protein